jgi:hypothetical protein
MFSVFYCKRNKGNVGKSSMSLVLAFNCLMFEGKEEINLMHKLCVHERMM